MKTYVRLKFNAKGSKPSEVYRIFNEHDFVPTIGEYDFVFDWGGEKEVNVSEILQKMDAIHNALQGKDVIYEVTTSDPMYHINEIIETARQPARQPSPAAQSSQPPAPTPPAQEAAEHLCKDCGKETAFIKSYNRWYCYTCKKYM